jgi:hypothetical protein
MPRSLKKISEKISSGTQKLFLTIWWYAVEKRLGTPGLDIKRLYFQIQVRRQIHGCIPEHKKATGCILRKVILFITGNDYEVKFQEIESYIFRRSKDQSRDQKSHFSGGQKSIIMHF